MLTADTGFTVNSSRGELVTCTLTSSPSDEFTGSQALCYFSIRVLRYYSLVEMCSGVWSTTAGELEVVVGVSIPSK